MWKQVSVLGLGVLVATSCAETTVEQTGVVANNSLGITAIQTEWSAAGQDKIFELRALNASDEEVGIVRVHIGTIADLASLPGTGTVGSEIVLSAAGQEERFITREVDTLHLNTQSNATLQEFLTIPEVASALGREGHVSIRTARAAESSYTTSQCPSSYVMTTPEAGQCCYDDVNPGTLFINPTGHSVFREGPSTPCRSATGGTCSGSGCYFGPAGFGRPVLSIAGNVVRIFDELDGTCGRSKVEGYNAFFNITGTIAPGAGCCANGSGPCADASACSACGGGAAGRGDWDY